MKSDTQPKKNMGRVMKIMSKRRMILKYLCLQNIIMIMFPLFIRMERLVIAGEKISARTMFLFFLTPTAKAVVINHGDHSYKFVISFP